MKIVPNFKSVGAESVVASICFSQKSIALSKLLSMLNINELDIFKKKFNRYIKMIYRTLKINNLYLDN